VVGIIPENSDDHNPGLGAINIRGNHRRYPLRETWKKANRSLELWRVSSPFYLAFDICGGKNTGSTERIPQWWALFQKTATTITQAWEPSIFEEIIEVENRETWKKANRSLELWRVSSPFYLAFDICGGKTRGEMMSACDAERPPMKA
jgi:hypothetical protein